MTWLHPEAFLLLLPAAALFWWMTGPAAGAAPFSDWRERWRRPGTLLRAVILVLAVVVLAAPVLVRRSAGADVLVVVDRSTSMPAASVESIEELIGLVETERGVGDRVGLVTFGGRATVERFPAERDRFSGFVKHVETDATDLAAGLATALQLVGTGRAGRVLVLTDGEYNGPDPRTVAYEAASRGLPVDFRLFERAVERDVAVDALDLPLSLLPGEAFKFSAWVSATERGAAGWVLTRDGEEIARGSVALRTGRNRLLFADRVSRSGPVRYRLEVNAGDDRCPENDVGIGVTRVEGEGGVLLVTHDGHIGNLGRAIAATGRPLGVARPKEIRLDLDTLSRYRALVLENVAAADLREVELRTIARWVMDGGGGLLLTGGRRAFGLGGYHKSPLDPVLPVSMELKKESRQLTIAMAFVLDRSGSMSARVPTGESKMELANSGCVAALDLLSARDQTAVVAVDSAPHVVVPMQPLTNLDAIRNDILSIEAMGGGIFTYTGLLAGSVELAKAKAATRHIILFADAADAEEPGEYVELLAKLRASGATVSVIALGQETDSDAEFLRDVAARGGGQCHFTDEPEALPRLFSLEAINVSRAAFVEEATGLIARTELRALGDLAIGDIPGVAGYNFTFLRDGATAGVRTADEEAAPALAFWQHGLGRVAAFTAEVDGAWSGDFAAWERFDSFFGTVANWIVGSDPPSGLVARAQRDGRTVTVRVELDPERPDDHPVRAPVLVAIPEDSDRPVLRLPLVWEAEHELAIRYRLEDGDVRHHRIEVDGALLLLNPVALPYSPEFESRVGRPTGRSVLETIAATTAGRERLAMSGLFEHEAASARYASLTLPLTALILALVILEIAWRRLGLGATWLSRWTSRARSQAPVVQQRTAPVVDSSPLTAAPLAAGDPALADEALELGGKTDPVELMKEAKRRARRS